MSSWTRARSAVAVAVRQGAPEPVIADLRRDLRAERLAEQIERVVAEAPPLTTEQCERLAMLLRPSAVSTPLDAA